MGNTNFGRDYGSTPTVNGAAISTDNPLPITGTVAVEGVEFTGTVNVVASGALTNRSGTITTGGVAQNAMAANASRKYARLKNPVTATENLYFSFTGTASTSSDYLQAGYELVTDSFVPTSALSIYAATTAHAFVAEEG